MHTFAHTHKRILNSCYLYPIHAGLHLQLLYSFPGLGDAGCAVVGDTVLHGAPVTPSRSTKGGHTESVNITLNPEAAAAPLAMSLTPLEQAILCHNLFFYLKNPFCLRESVLQQRSSILSEERRVWWEQLDSVIFQSVFMHGQFSFLP